MTSLISSKRHLDHPLDLDAAVRHVRHLIGLCLREGVPGRVRHQVVVSFALGGDTDARLQGRVVRTDRAQLLAHLDIRLDEHSSEAAGGRSGAISLLKRFAYSAEAAWFGAIVFAFSGFNLLHLSHMNVVAIANPQADERRTAAN